MDNPFRKRASENVLESEAFLQLVSDEPVAFVFDKWKNRELFEKLTFLLGTPGSGKTTIGRLFEFRNLHTLNALKEHDSYKDLAQVMTEYGAIVEDAPSLLGARLVMDSEYRSIWELDYEPSLKLNLFLTLIQSRCVLLWLNALRQQGIPDLKINIRTNSNSQAAIKAIGAENVGSFREMAVRVEEAVYRLVHALVPVKVENIPDQLTLAYNPLSTITGIEVSEYRDRPTVFQPMVLIDDAHELHSMQFKSLTDWLISREIAVARWIVTRFDIATSANKWILRVNNDNAMPGRQAERDYIVLTTNQVTNTTKKRSFRAAANNIAGRYLGLMSMFNRSSLTNLSSLLEEKSPEMAAGNLTKLEAKIEGEIAELNIARDRVDKLKSIIEGYKPSQREAPDVKLSLLRILLHRYAKRTPQQALFAEPIDVDPNRELSIDKALIDGAKLFLLHEYNRPFYYGFDSLVDAGNGNIEQFLKSADVVVTALEAKLIRKRQPILDAALQHKLLTATANDAIQKWNFPLSDKVRLLLEFIGNQALEMSLRPNAPLSDGANAYGVLGMDYDRIEKDFPQLGQVLHYAMAYNAITVIPEYSCKNQIWTLIELGGYPTIKKGLTFKRGGFVEGKSATINNYLFGEQL